MCCEVGSAIDAATQQRSRSTPGSRISWLQASCHHPARYPVAAGILPMTSSIHLPPFRPQLNLTNDARLELPGVRSVVSSGSPLTYGRKAFFPSAHSSATPAAVSLPVINRSLAGHALGALRAEGKKIAVLLADTGPPTDVRLLDFHPPRVLWGVLRLVFVGLSPCGP